MRRFDPNRRPAKTNSMAVRSLTLRLAAARVAALRPTTTAAATNQNVGFHVVRRDKAALSSGAPDPPGQPRSKAGSNRSSHGGNEMAEAPPCITGGSSSGPRKAGLPGNEASLKAACGSGRDARRLSTGQSIRA